MARAAPPRVRLLLIAVGGVLLALAIAVLLVDSPGRVESARPPPPGEQPAVIADEPELPAAKSTVEELLPVTPGPDPPTSAGEPAQPTCRVSARIVDERGAGIASAAVRHGRGPPEQLSADVTGPDGRWSTEVVRTEGRDWWRLEAAAPGHESVTVEVPFLDGPVLDLGDIRLVERRRITGRVIDRSGSAVVGARVAAVAARRSVTHRAIRKSSETAVTGRDGAFVIELDAVPAHYDLRLVAWHATLGGPFTKEFGPPDAWPREPVDVVLGEGASVRGVVIDADGQPLTGAVITPLLSPWHELEPVTTDASGRFTVTSTAGHEVQLRTALPDFVELDGPVRAEVPAEDVTIVMVGACRLTVAARDAATGDELDAFDVAFCSMTYGYGRCHELAGRAGLASRDDLPPGTWDQLVVTADGYLDAPLAPLTVDEHQVVGPLSVALSPRARDGIVTGRTFDASGSGVAAALVRVFSGDAPVGEVAGSTRTDDAGRFRIEDVPVDRCVLVATREDGLSSAPLAGHAASTGWHGADLFMREPARLSGIVWTSPTAPAAGALVWLEPDKPRADPPPSTTCAADGSFELVCPPGRYRLEAWHAKPSPADPADPAVAPDARLELAAGEHRFVDVPLTASVMEVTGTVRAEEDVGGWSMTWKRIEDQTPLVDWELNQTMVYAAPLDARGAYRISGATVGRFQVHILRADGTPAAERVVAIEPGLERSVVVDFDVRAAGG